MTDPRIDQIAKLKQTIAMLEDQQRTLGVDLSLSLNQTRELLAKLEQTEPVNALPLWGVRLNQHNTYSRKRSDPLPEGCPTWVKPFQIEDWDKRGLIVWNNETRQFHKFWASQALGFLEKLRAQNEWRDTAIVLTQTIQRQIVPAEPQPKRSRKKKGATTEPPPAQEQEPEPKYEEFEKEQVRLPISAGDDFFTFLVSHEATLREMAAADEKERSRILGQVYDLILKFDNKREAAEIDLAVRSLPWVRSESGLKFVCDRPPNRATVYLTTTNLYWQACVEQPHHFKHESTWFLKVEEALTWAEKELLLAEQEQTTPTEVADEPLPVSTLDLTPFWIDPAILEPARITYRVVMFIQREPTTFKTLEMSFGEKMKYDEEYPGPQALARELGIDSAQMAMKQIVPDTGLYRVKSNVTYFNESLAATQAQAAWDHSSIMKAFQQGSLISAEYGYEEVETGYEIHLGKCEKPGTIQHTPLTRAEYLAHTAMRHTLLNALDVDGFRAHIGLKKKYVSDEDLLVTMHEERAKSPYLPQAARSASQQWLTENAQLIKQLLRQQGSRP